MAASDVFTTCALRWKTPMSSASIATMSSPKTTQMPGVPTEVTRGFLSRFPLRASAFPGGDG
jgi:hypothetical protein